MKLSKTFIKTQKEISSQEKSINAILLQRAGFIDRVLAGVYTYLPFGLRTIKKIENIVRKGMNEIGGEELYMPALSTKSIWETTGRWNEIDVLFKLQGMWGQDLALGPTHEEIITPLIKKYVKSYKDLPVSVYQIQTKFRNEKRAKSGILRGREFIMKDLYSFHENVEDLEKYYNVVLNKYLDIFEEIGLDAYVVDASGGTFSKKPSHEFQVLTDAGEDLIWYSTDDNFAVNNEDVESLPDLYEIEKNNGEITKVIHKPTKKELKKGKASEIGNIFKLYDKFSKAFDFKIITRDGNQAYVQMGCYGIGISRLMGVVVEKYHDEKGLKWPENIAPYKFIIIPIGNTNEKAEKIYNFLNKKYPDEVVLDDRKESPGFKLKDADLIGYSYQIIVSNKTLEKGENIVEITDRITGEKKFMDYEKI